ncbi:hypothetical protein NEDG_02091 [Nematocida displodere]|uniref:Uncharacterized protein n=1 Tax=Nematocida displodere TaxID=1805483 RepID=A0A177EM34_9MICR|nr:hypothetical protein NEDG_02091 [Nematocida displodere]
MGSRIARYAMLCAIVFCLSVRTEEAEYDDSFFELNKPGFLYNLGVKKFIGIDFNNQDHLIAINDKRNAIRVRVHINNTDEEGGFVIFHDINDDTIQYNKPNIVKGDSKISKQMGFEVCPEKKVGQCRVVLKNFHGRSSGNFFFTQPLIFNENGFSIKIDHRCLTIGDDNKTLSATNCGSNDKLARNKQLFVWVDLNSHNRDFIPGAFAPNPQLNIPNPAQELIHQLICSTPKSVMPNLLDSPSNHAHKSPYDPFHSSSAVPASCLS